MCSPFQLQLLAQMRLESVPLKAIALRVGFQHGYTKRPLSEDEFWGAWHWAGGIQGMWGVSVGAVAVRTTSPLLLITHPVASTSGPAVGNDLVVADEELGRFSVC